MRKMFRLAAEGCVLGLAVWGITIACGGGYGSTQNDPPKPNAPSEHFQYLGHSDSGTGFDIFCDNERNNLIYQERDRANIAVVHGGC